MTGSTTRSAATVVLRLPASAAHVRTARLVAAAMARRSGVEEGLLDEVRLAVGEACARAVRLHERYGVEAPVTVEFADQDRFSVAVIDSAPGHDPVPWTGAADGGDSTALSGHPGTIAAAPSTRANASDDGQGIPGTGGVRGREETETGNLVPIRPTGSPIDPPPGSPAVHDQRPVAAGGAPETAWSWLDSTTDSLGLALLDAVVQDLAVSEVETGVGTRVAMSWPLDR